MAAATRIGDSTTGTCNVGALCCPHGRAGINVAGSPNVYINGQPAHRTGDAGDCRCPHGGSFKTTGGSGTVFVNGKPATRIGDATVCQNCGQSGSHATGSGNVFVG